MLRTLRALDFMCPNVRSLTTKKGLDMKKSSDYKAEAVQDEAITIRDDVMLSVDLHDLKMKHGIDVNIVDGKELILSFNGRESNKGWSHLDVDAFGTAWDYTDSDRADMQEAIELIHTRITIGKVFKGLAHWDRWDKVDA